MLRSIDNFFNYQNVGHKIKLTAQWCKRIGMLVSFACALWLGGVCTFGTSPGILFGFVVFVAIAFIGCLVSWLVGLCLYGFGELIDQQRALAETMQLALLKQNAVQESTESGETK